MHRHRETLASPRRRTATVLYVAAEGAYGLHDRLRAWEYARQTTIEPASLHTLPGPVHLGHRGDVAELAALVTEGGYGFVVVDTIAKCMVGMDENSAQDMGRVVDALYWIREAMGDGTVLAVHHTGKDKVTSRGSSALESGVDTIYATEGDPRQIILARTKRKEGPPDDKLMLRLSHCEYTGGATIGAFSDVRGHDGRSSAEQVMSAFMSAFSVTGATKAELRLAASMPPASFYRGVNALVRQGQLINTGTDTRPFYQLPRSN